MNTASALRFITLPDGKSATDTVGERHDIVLLFDCAKSNPNGDPDTGNMPRVQPDSLRGLVTDVCLKRKIRNFFALHHPDDGSPIEQDAANRPRYAVFVREGAVFERLLKPEALEERAKAFFMKNKVEGLTFDEKAWKSAGSKKGSESNDAAEPQADAPSGSEPGESGKGKKKKKPAGNPYAEYRDRAFRDTLCDANFDARFFGQVASTEGALKGSFYGQIRGPLQFTFAESFDKILPIDATITRCAVASEAEAAKKDDDNRTMGRKHGIDYGLYRCHIHFSPAFAAKTGFTYTDLDNFFFALTHMFDDDHAAGRHLRLVGLVDFQHSSALGNAPAHKLFELVKVRGIKVHLGKDSQPSSPQPDRSEEGRDFFNGKWVFKSSGSEFPRGLEDYEGDAAEGDYHLKDGKVLSGKNGEGVSAITARRIVWEVPPPCLVHRA